MTRRLLVLALLASGSCAVHHATVAAPTRYVIPLSLDPDAAICVELQPHQGRCVTVYELRKLLASIGHS